MSLSQHRSMSANTLVFLPKPAQSIAKRGERFAAEVIDTLRRWFRSQEGIVAERHGVVMLSPTPGAEWGLIVIPHRTRHRMRAEVWHLEFGGDHVDVLTRYAPFVGAKHHYPVTEFSVDNLQPGMFMILSEMSAARQPSSPVEQFAPIVERYLSHLFRESTRRRVDPLIRRYLIRLLREGSPSLNYVSPEEIVSLGGLAPVRSKVGSARELRGAPLSANGLQRLPLHPLGHLGTLPELRAR